MYNEETGAANALKLAPADKFFPRGDYLLVTVEKDPGVVGGIYKPERAKEIPPHGRVLRAGPDSDIPTGKRVLFVKHAGKKISLDGEIYQVIRSSEVYAILSDDVELA